ncbi:MAG TPA: hypothetical protein VEG27_11400 [Usitatibacter sp.]|nr:hypothetical protein [Usitatibacter sp.]
MNEVRVERMLKELHSAPPLRLLEDITWLAQAAGRRIAALRARRASKEQVLGAPVLAGNGAVR